MNAKIVAPGIGVVALLCWAVASHAQDVGAYQAAIDKLAESSKQSDSAMLAGIGQIYCQMRGVAEADEPVRPQMVLSVLHKKHPDSRPKSNAGARAQRQAIAIAEELLCPGTPQ